MAKELCRWKVMDLKTGRPPRTVYAMCKGLHLPRWLWRRSKEVEVMPQGAASRSWHAYSGDTAKGQGPWSCKTKDLASPTTWRSLLLKLQKRAIPKTPWWQSRESNAGILTHRAVKAVHLCCVKPLHLWEFVRAAIGIWHECANDSHTAWAKSTCWVSCRPRDGKACDLKHPWPLQVHWTVWGWDQFSLWGFFFWGGAGWREKPVYLQ